MPELPRSSRPSRPRAARHLPAASRITRDRLAFLYGDVGLSQKAIAKLLATSISAVERAVRSYMLKPLTPTYGAYDRATFSRFVRMLRKSVAEPSRELPPEEVWIVMRKIMRREVPAFFASSATPLYPLDGFLGDLPYLLKAAEARLTKARIRVLHGDLFFSKRQIAELLDAPMPIVERAFIATGPRGVDGMLFLGNDGCQRLAQALGRAEWYVESDVKDSLERTLRKHLLAARKGVYELAREGRVDWSAVDRFILAEAARRTS